MINTFHSHMQYISFNFIVSLNLEVMETNQKAIIQYINLKRVNVAEFLML